MGGGYNRNCCVMNRYTTYPAVNGATHGLVLQSHTATAIENTGFTAISTRHYMKNYDPFLPAIRPCTTPNNTSTRLTGRYWQYTSPQFTATDNYIRKLFTKQHWGHALRRKILWANRPPACRCGILFMKLAVTKLQDNDLNHGCSTSPNSLHVPFSTLKCSPGFPVCFACRYHGYTECIATTATDSSFE